MKANCPHCLKPITKKAAWRIEGGVGISYLHAPHTTFFSGDYCHTSINQSKKDLNFLTKKQINVMQKTMEKEGVLS